MLSMKMKKGETRRVDIRLAQKQYIYRPIQTVDLSAPVVIQCDNHDLPNGWPFYITGIKGGGSQLNSDKDGKLKTSHIAKVLDIDHIEINDANGTSWSPYQSGGIVQYRDPVDLTGVSVIMHFRREVLSPEILFSYSTNDYITIDTRGKISILFQPTDTAGLLINTGYFDLDIIFQDNSILKYPVTKVTFSDEVTR